MNTSAESIKSRKLQKFIGIVFLVVGMTITYFGMKILGNAHASKSWPSVKGQVISAEVEKKVNRDSKRHGANRGSTTYKAEILYRYELEGKRHLSNQVSFSELSTNSPKGPSKVVNQYPAGSKVTVYYSPDDPALSVLEPGVNLGSFFLPAFGLLFFSVGGAVTFFVGRKPVTERAQEETGKVTERSASVRQ